ncbi:SDR family NAD(P)-dependent oxidoreductase [Phosphitispora sp. TUW77]|uniref:SDR family NAD(P)-dependent oxidoreductase n=1 Tax=Phosphitispora sp. TUW77 TaxID=3152361 RepID=UPI003AB1BCC8
MGIMEGKVVIITGGGQNIGKGVAIAFAKEGASLVITDVVEEVLVAAKEEFERDYGIKVLALIADGSAEEAVKSAIQKTVEMFGRIDVIINNAHRRTTQAPLENYTEEDFMINFRTGPLAAFFYMKHALPYLKETKGSVINLGSGGHQNGMLEAGAYNTSKAATSGLTRSAANEWGKYGINVNELCPVVMTPAFEEWIKKYPEMYQRTVIERTAMRRVGDSENDIGRICVFLASADAKYLTAQCINADGGNIIRP